VAAATSRDDNGALGMAKVKYATGTGPDSGGHGAAPRAAGHALRYSLEIRRDIAATFVTLATKDAEVKPKVENSVVTSQSEKEPSPNHF
jgi:hypothetical protein